MPNTISPIMHRQRAPVVAHDEREPEQRDRAEGEASRPICRGVILSYSRTISIAVKNTVRLNGIIAMAVSIGERPWTIWI